MDLIRERGATLKAALALTAAVLVVELAGGLVSGSLALLSDAGHVLTDVFALGLAWFALEQAKRPGDKRRTYGYQRAGILAALLNGFLIGYYGGLFDSHHLLGPFFCGVAPHGVLELPALVLAAAFALRLGASLVHPARVQIEVLAQNLLLIESSVITLFQPLVIIRNLLKQKPILKWRSAYAEGCGGPHFLDTKTGLC